MSVRRTEPDHTPRDLPSDEVRRARYRQRVDAIRAQLAELGDLRDDHPDRRALLRRLDSIYENASGLRDRDPVVRRLRREIRAAEVSEIPEISGES